MATKIEFDGGVVTLREPNRHERIAAMDQHYELDALTENATIPREMFERAEATLLKMVESVDRGGVVLTGDEARAWVNEMGLLLVEGIGWLRAITFRQAGTIAARNGDVGLGSSPARQGAEREGQSAAKVSD